MAVVQHSLRIGINGSGARSGGKEVEGALDGISKKAGQAIGNVDRASKGAASSLLTLKSALAGFAISSLAGTILKTAASYETLRSALVTATKSTYGAQVAFADLKKFADATPYTLEQATKAYIRMSSAGLKPSIAALTDFGDIASAIPGKDILDFVEAVADGTQGQGRRLKEFGIDLNNQGSKVELVFGDMRTVVENNAKAIEEGIRGIAKAQFGGSMERQSKTLIGLWSTLEDKAAGLADQIGQGGLVDALKEVVVSLTETAAGSESTAQSLGAALGTTIRAAAVVVKFLADNFDILVSILAGFAAAAFISAIPIAITAMSTAFLGLVSSMLLATGGAVTFRGAMVALAASNPLGWVVLGVAALVEVIQHWDYISDKISKWVPPIWADDGGNLGGEVDRMINAANNRKSGGTGENTNYYIPSAAQQESFNRAATAGIEIITEYAGSFSFLKNNVGQTSDELNEFLKKKRETEDTKKKASGLFAAAVADPSWIKQQNDSVDAAKQASKTRAETIQGLSEQLRIQKAVYEATITGGDKAAKIEEKYQAAISGKGFKDPAELLLIRQKTEAIVEGESALEKYAAGIAAVSAANIAAQAAEEKKVESKVNFFQALYTETETQKTLAEAIKISSREYEFQTKFLSALATAESQNITLNEDQISLLRDKINLQLDYADSISKTQTQNKDLVKKDKEKSPIETMIEQYTDLISITKEWQNIAVDGINTFATTLNDALWGGEVDFAEFAKTIGKQITELLIKLALAAALKAVIGGATGGFGSVIGGGKIGSMLLGGSFHTGGIVGAGGGTPRAISPGSIVGAPRLHTGTIPTLAGDEYAAILQRGEEVLTRAQSARLNGALRVGASTPSFNVNRGAADSSGGDSAGGGRGVSRGSRARGTTNITYVLPGVRDSRGFGRSARQESATRRRRDSETEE